MENKSKDIPFEMPPGAKVLPFPPPSSTISQFGPEGSLSQPYLSKPATLPSDPLQYRKLPYSMNEVKKGETSSSPYLSS
jgi:hypothetical protein